MRPLTLVSLVGLIALLVASIYIVFKPSYNSFYYPSDTSTPLNSNQEEPITTVNVDQNVIMGYMGNRTAKAELGRATWKFLHTMMARYPEKPLAQERQALHDFMMLFSRLYPCGECAEHFNKLLLEYPPQTSSQFAASQWLCAMHNIVNEKLHKPIYDCKDIDSQYPCGCDNSTTTSTTK